MAQLMQGPVDLLVVDEHVTKGDPLKAFESHLHTKRPPIVLLSDPLSVERLIETYQQGVTSCIMKPVHIRETVSCIYALLRQQRRIVCLGGGTGLYVLLLGLKTLPNVHLTSVVSMSDDGGSSGRIREAFGILPPGDVRRSLVALSTAPAFMNDLIQYRFQGDEDLRDHNLGNLLLTAMANLKGSMAEAIRAMGDILNIQGVVLPVTTTPNTLVAELADGTIVRGEHRIDVPQDRDPNVRIARLWQEPEAVGNPNALSAILAADLITIGPGDLLTSIAATLAVKGVSKAVRAARGRKLYICNLVTKPGETSHFTVADHIREVVRYLGEDVLDEVLVSNTPLSPEALTQYASKNQEPVRLDDDSVLRQVTNARLVVRDIGLEQELVRHHSVKLANEIASLFALPARSSQPTISAVPAG